VPVVVICCLMSFYLAGTYRGQWKLISVEDIPRYAVGAGGGTILSLATVTLVSRFADHSRGAFVIFGLLLLLSVCTSRVSFRLFDALIFQHKRDSQPVGSKTLLIYGAGKTGKLVCEQIMSSGLVKDCFVLGFVDDDPRQFGRTLCGRPIRSEDDWLKRHWGDVP